jgi:hypothetical protein
VVSPISQLLRLALDYFWFKVQWPCTVVTEHARGEKRGREEEALAELEPSVWCFFEGNVPDSATSHSQPMLRVKEATSNMWRGCVLESLLVRSDRFA